MNKISVKDLKPGMAFSKTVYLDKDTVFVNANMQITEAEILKLRKFGIKEVQTKGEPVEVDRNSAGSLDDILSTEDLHEEELFLKEIFDKTNKLKTEFTALYNETVENVKSIYTTVSVDKYIEINKVRDNIEKIVDHVRENPQFSYTLLGLPVTSYYLYNQVTFALFYSVLIGQLLEFSRPKLIDLGIAGFFADIGMTKIPPGISEKTSKLTDEELKVFVRHPLVGYQLITQKIKLKSSLAFVSLHHHENFNGTGYPQKIKGKDIDQMARIYTIADNFSALVNNRPWRKKSLPYEVMKGMISTDVNKFDLNIIRPFLAVMSMYPVGSCAELSDGRIGLVIASSQDKPLRPSLRIIKNSDGSFLKKLSFVNLSKNTDLYITRALDITTAIEG